jgi:hypothetical protein
MTKMELTSFIGWVDLSEEDEKRARDYLKSLAEGTLDELGFGVIRDTFADLFFPATSTIMTRARYFILVPAIYLHVLGRKLMGEAARKQCDRLEQDLRTLLIRNNAIPRTRRDIIQRYPASIYWAGLRRLGIYGHGGSQARYFHGLQDYYESQSGIVDDDKNSHGGDDAYDLWDTEIVHFYDAHQIPVPDPKSGFAPDTKLDVTKIEAEYLKRRFLADETATVISNVFRHDAFEPESYPWDWDYPEQLDREIRHSEQFSMHARIATLVYYAMLDQMRQDNGHAAAGVDLMESIAFWWDAARDRHANWDVADFIKWTGETKSQRGNDVHFIKSFHHEVTAAKSATSFAGSSKVQNLIVAREKDKRPNKRRLKPGRFLAEWKLPGQWSSEDSIYQLDFRAGIASTIVEDIFKGLQR